VASQVYPKYKEVILGAGCSFSTLNIKVALVSTKYTYSAAHQFLSSILSTQAVKKSTTNLASKTVTSGLVDAADITLASVSGVKVNAIVLYRDTGTSGTSNLILYTTAVGLPFTPIGSNITIAWDNGTNRIFQL